MVRTNQEKGKSDYVDSRQTLKITEFDLSEIGIIKSLWQELNSLHGSKSTHFKAYFDSFTFESRVTQLRKKTKCKIFVATELKNSEVPNSSVPSPLLGYCIASVDEDRGEIDSIYVHKECRKSGVGDSLMQGALDWLTDLGCENIIVLIAEGNEQVFPFYRRHGFKERFTVMQVHKKTGEES